MDTIKKISFLTELDKLLNFMDEPDKRQTILLYDGMFEEAFDEDQLSEMLVSPTRQAVYLARSYNNRLTAMDLQIRSRYVETDSTDKSLPSYIRAINRIYDDAEKKGIISPDNIDPHKYDSLDSTEVSEELQQDEYAGDGEEVIEPQIEEVAEAAEETEIYEPDITEQQKNNMQGILSGLAATMASLAGNTSVDEDEDEDYNGSSIAEDLSYVDEDELNQIAAVQEMKQEAAEYGAHVESQRGGSQPEAVAQAPVSQANAEEEIKIVIPSLDDILAEISGGETTEAEPDEESFDKFFQELMDSTDEEQTDVVSGESAYNDVIEDVIAEEGEIDAAEAAAAAVEAAAAIEAFDIDEMTSDAFISALSEDDLDSLLSELTDDDTLNALLGNLTGGEISLDNLNDEPVKVAESEKVVESISEESAQEPVQEIKQEEGAKEEVPFVRPETKRKNKEEYLASLAENKRREVKDSEDEDENHETFEDIKPRNRNFNGRSLDPAVQALLNGKSLKEARAIAEGQPAKKSSYLVSGKSKPKEKLNGAKVALFVVPAIIVTLLVLALLLIPLSLSGAGAALAVALGVFCFGAAFSGFSIVADVLIVLGAAVIMLALGLLLAWCFVWLIIGVVPSYFKWLAELCRKLCAKKGE